MRQQAAVSHVQRICQVPADVFCRWVSRRGILWQRMIVSLAPVNVQVQHDARPKRQSRWWCGDGCYCQPLLDRWRCSRCCALGFRCTFAVKLDHHLLPMRLCQCDLAACLPDHLGVYVLRRPHAAAQLRRHLYVLVPS